MNSNNKYQENQQNKASESEKLSGASQVLAQKIKHVIRGYQYRKLAAQDEIADLSRVNSYMTEEGLDRSGVRSRIATLKEEINFCHNQILAYLNNDNKAKIIPDRLL